MNVTNEHFIEIFKKATRAPGHPFNFMYASLSKKGVEERTYLTIEDTTHQGYEGPKNCNFRFNGNLLINGIADPFDISSIIYKALPREYFGEFLESRVPEFIEKGFSLDTINLEHTLDKRDPLLHISDQDGVFLENPKLISSESEIRKYCEEKNIILKSRDSQ